MIEADAKRAAILLGVDDISVLATMTGWRIAVRIGLDQQSVEIKLADIEVASDPNVELGRRLALLADELKRRVANSDPTREAMYRSLLTDEELRDRILKQDGSLRDNYALNTARGEDLDKIAKDRGSDRRRTALQRGLSRGQIQRRPVDRFEAISDELEYEDEPSEDRRLAKALKARMNK